MGIVAWIVLGAIAGWITNLIGAVVGGYLAGTVLGIADVTGVNVESIVVAVVGAIIVVVIYRAVAGRRTTA